MTPFAEYFTLLSSLAVVAEQIAIVALVTALARGVYEHRIFRWVAVHAMELMFAVALASVVGSLVYSNVIGFAPCVLCWWQRVLLYPQVIILAVALYKKQDATPYVLAFSLPGVLLAAYHYWGQMFTISALPCGVPGPGVVSCADRYFVEFGYITIPMMSLTAFALLVAFAFYARRFARIKEQM
jgi:disulfide bond formation protein DsbB